VFEQLRDEQVRKESTLDVSLSGVRRAEDSIDVLELVVLRKKELGEVEVSKEKEGRRY